MSLLTPSESHAFQSFLTSMDYSESNSDQWYSENIPVPQHGKEDLAKATKDLMSLDGDRWNQQQQNHQQPNYDYYSNQQPHFGHFAPQRHQHQFPQSRRNVTFPFLSKHEQPRPQLVLPLEPPGPDMQYPASSSSSTSSFSFGHQIHPSPSSPSRHSPGLAGSKRPLDGPTMSISKRSRPSPPAAYPYSRPSSSVSTPILASSKPALLSPSQKKANHIQSEQKRRANIRRGYEALCESVPALVEAIRAEEGAQGTGRDPKSRSKRGKGRAKAEDNGEKTDGRAGPRSENVVLMKTIDYVNELLSERSSLLTRLEQARAALPEGHPALLPPTFQPLWEREWKGGENKDDEDEEEDDVE